MGFATVAGGSRATAPSAGILASDIAVGSMVKLMESGSAVDYRVVHQGLPGSLYDASCNGCWLLRKDLLGARAWDTSYTNSYKSSAIHTWLNGDYFNSLGSVEQAVIKQVKIPYVNGTGNNGSVASGGNGLLTKIFLLSKLETGLPTSSSTPDDGVTLSYFNGTAERDSKRIAYINGVARSWWNRSPSTRDSATVWLVDETGIDGGLYAYNTECILPALILPSNAKFDADTMLLKGVA